MSGAQDVAQVIRNLSKYADNVIQEIGYGAEAVQAKTINDARANCPVGYTGALSQSIQAGPITITNTNVEAIVIANMDYASYVEFPTKPHFPPIDALKDWARKFLGDEKLAYAMALAISRRGTYAQPFMGPALLANQSTFRNAIVAAVQRAKAA